MDSAQRRVLIHQTRNIIQTAETMLNDLVAGCVHDFRKHHESAICWICGKDGGWWCPKSPNGCCVYTKTLDQCDYCGDPEERK